MIILFIILYIVFKICDSQDKNEINFLSYTEDDVLGFRWEWIWKKNYDGRYDVDNLYPICKICKTPLTRDDDYHILCLRCNRRYSNKMPYSDDVKMMIKDNVRKGLYPKSNNKKLND